MKWILVLIVVVSANSSASELCEKFPILGTQQSDGTYTKVYLAESKVLNAGAWDKDSEEPPLSVGQAREIADSWIAQNLNGFEKTVIWQVRLNRFPCPASHARTSGLYWFYDIKYYLEYNDRTKKGPGYLVVLMSGEVIAPIVE